MFKILIISFFLLLSAAAQTAAPGLCRSSTSFPMVNEADVAAWGCARFASCQFTSAIVFAGTGYKHPCMMLVDPYPKGAPLSLGDASQFQRLNYVWSHNGSTVLVHLSYLTTNLSIQATCYDPGRTTLAWYESEVILDWSAMTATQQCYTVAFHAVCVF